MPDTDEVRALLRNSHLLYVGDPAPPAESGGDWGPEALKRRFGITMSFVSTEGLLSRAAAVPDRDAGDELERWRSSFTEVGPSDADLRGVVRMYLALRDLARETGANALAVRCGPLRDYWTGVPCLALARLLDEGLVASCEADLPATLAMLLLHRLSGAPVLMGNFGARPGALGARDDEVSVNHCIIPLTMSSDSGWRVRDYHGSGLGVTGYAALPAGQPVTLLHLTADLGEFRVLEGTTQGSSEGVGNLCRVIVHVRPDGEVDRVPVEILESGHMAVGIGHWADDLEALAGQLGLGVRRL